MDGYSHPHVDAPRIEALLEHARWIEELAHRLVRDEASAEDVAQATWVRALRTEALPRTNVRAWLARVVRNLARESKRREAQRAHVERRGARAEALPSSTELVLRADAERALVEAVLGLEDPHRQLLLLRYFEGLSVEEIARREGAPVATVSNRLTRAHSLLRERLARHHEGSWLAALAPIVAHRIELHPDPSVHVPMASTSSVITVTAVLMSTLTKVMVSCAAIAIVVWWIASRTDGEVAPAKAATLAVMRPQDVIHTRAEADPSPSERVAVTNQVDGPSSVQAAAPTVTVAPTAAPVAAPAKGGRIHGRVYRPDGELAPARKVRLFHTPRGPQLFATSDEHGTFDAKDLAPGKWACSSRPDEAECKALGLEPDPTQVEFLSQRTVELADGDDVVIELGAPPKNPIRVSGHVIGIDPAPDAILHWVPEGEDGLDRAKYTHSFADGNYAVVLERPGAYLVSALLPGPVRVERVIDVPDERAFAYDIEVPRGVIRGRVRTEEGQPVQKATVQLTPRAGCKPFLFQSSFAFQRTTDDEGRFEFGLLQPGTYAVSVANGNINGRGSAAVAVSGVVVTHERNPDELDIVLKRALAIVHGHANARGSESPYYTNLFVFDASGEPVNPLAAAISDKDGKFELPPLSRGRYSVVGANGNDWTHPVEFEVRDGEPAPTVELTLQPSATLLVEGANLGEAWIDVRDDAGNCFSALLDKNLFTGAITRACLVNRWRYLVPDGNYEVRATSSTGVVARGQSSVIAGETRIVLLTR